LRAGEKYLNGFSCGELHKHFLGVKDEAVACHILWLEHAGFQSNIQIMVHFVLNK
jgi:hypothetical protein